MEFLKPSHPTRLEIHLKYSELMHDIFDLKSEAIDSAKNAYYKSLSDSQNYNIEKESIYIMQKIKDNIEFWMNE